MIAVPPQVAELREMVGWLTSLQHYVKEAAVNPTPKGLPVGLLDPKVRFSSSSGSSSRAATRTASHQLQRQRQQQ
jgi:hypothetical protein